MNITTQNRYQYITMIAPSIYSRERNMKNDASKFGKALIKLTPSHFTLGGGDVGGRERRVMLRGLSHSETPAVTCLDVVGGGELEVFEERG